MKSANPYLYFPGNTEEAFAFYRSVFGGDAPSILRYRDMGIDGDMGMNGEEADLVAHVRLSIADDIVLMASDAIGASLKDYRVGTNVEIRLAPDDAEEARRVFGALAEGGKITMPLERVAWSELFGYCIDRYGVRWMMDYEGDAQFAMP